MAERNTFNEYIPPFIDEEKKLIIFSMVHYHVSNDETRNGYYKTLSSAVSAKDYSKIMRVLKDMAPYIIKSKIQVAMRQTRIVDSVTREKV